MDLMTTERVSQGLMGGNATYMPHRAQGRYPNQVLYADNMLPCNVMYTTNAVRVAGGFWSNESQRLCLGHGARLQSRMPLVGHQLSPFASRGNMELCA